MITCIDANAVTGLEGEGTGALASLADLSWKAGLAASPAVVGTGLGVITPSKTGRRCRRWARRLAEPVGADLTALAAIVAASTVSRVRFGRYAFSCALYLSRWTLAGSFATALVWLAALVA
jgi:hypothetical protein